MQNNGCMKCIHTSSWPILNKTQKIEILDHEMITHVRNKMNMCDSGTRVSIRTLVSFRNGCGTKEKKINRVNTTMTTN